MQVNVLSRSLLLRDSGVTYRSAHALPKAKPASGGKHYLPDHSRHLPVVQNKGHLAVSTMAPTNDNGGVQPLIELLLQLQGPTSAPHYGVPAEDRIHPSGQQEQRAAPVVTSCWAFSLSSDQAQPGVF